MDDLLGMSRPFKHQLGLQYRETRSQEYTQDQEMSVALSGQLRGCGCSLSPGFCSSGGFREASQGTFLYDPITDQEGEQLNILHHYISRP